MRRLLPLFVLLAGMLAGGRSQAQGDCLNFSPFGEGTPLPDGSVTTLSGCVFFGEYSTINGVVAGANYEITITNSGYITVREGLPDGPVIAQGVGSVQVTPTTSGVIYAHFNTDETCGALSECQTATVQWLLDCEFPQATVTYDTDCDLGQYTINVEITSTGDGSTVDLTYTVNGVEETIPGIGTGTESIGPFAIGDLVDVVIAHELDPICNLSLLGLEPPVDCPVQIVCGELATSFAYCYANNENKTWTYNGLGGGTLMLNFLSGSIESASWDVLTIYDGVDATAPVLYVHDVLNTVDLTGLSVVSTTGSLHMVLTSDGVVSCDDQSLIEWNWTVVCLNCQMPQVSIEVEDDCGNNAFNVNVDVLSSGDGGTVGLVYTVDGGAPQSLSGLAEGVTTIGPFTINSIVSIEVEHGSDPACNFSAGTYTDNGLCPTLITCGDPALEETYCYEPNDFQYWVYQSVGSGTLRLRFLRGTIESSSFDQLRIHDGPDNTAPLLFSHDEFEAYNLGPVGSAVNNTFYPYHAIEVYATGNDLYMEMESDGSVSCGGPFPAFDFDAWEWEVVCLDCTIPVVNASVVDDCAANAFTIPVDVTSTGDGATVNIVYTVNGGVPEVLTGVGVGITDLGPFTINDVVNVVVEHENNELCNIDLGDITDTGTCPTLVECGSEFNETLCHGDGIDERYYYQGTGTFPLALLFNSGSLENCCDRLFVYDGEDITAPELTPPGGAFGDVAGLFFSSTNPENRLTVRITTDLSVSCQTGFQTELDWTLSCLDCNPPSATFSIVQDCENFQYFIDVDVTTLGSDPEVEVTNTGGVDALTITEPGLYQIGPFVSGTPVEVTLVNDANSLCNLSSEVLVNPLCPTIVCGATPVVETYCYGPNEDQAWAYELPGTSGTLHLTFDRGTIESATWDVLTIYDGPDESGPILFQHNNFATYNLGPVGSAVNNTIANFYGVDVVSTTGNLYMTLTSDPSVYCDGNPTYDPMEWQVYCEGCQPPGVAYNLVPNCFDRTYKAEVIITNAPPAEGLQIGNTITGETQTANAIGVYEFGPYAQDSPVLFEFISLDNPLCSYFSDELTYASADCVIRTCGFDNYTHCYGNDEDRWYTFQADAAVPITIGFVAGQMLPGDRIVLYNGFDETAAVLYQGNNGGNLTGFALNSQNVNNALTLRIQSNADGSCADEGSGLAPLQWWVACGAVGVDEQGQGSFSLYPNPTDGLLYIDLGAEALGMVQLRIMDMSGRLVYERSINAAGAPNTVDLEGLTTGQYLVQLTADGWTRTNMVQVAR